MVTAALACRAALEEATRLWPRRSRISDGILPSAAHTIRNPSSDHELGNAWDLTHDPDHGVNCHLLAQVVIADPRIKYVIWDGQIWNPAVSPMWRMYGGTNPHRTHMHVSIKAACRNDTSPWFAHPVFRSSKEPAVADNPDLPNITGPLTFHPIVDANGICQGYYIFAPSTGEVHGHGPGARWYGRSEDPTPGG